jgi:glycosyltransferase involved in cell wall biosynthesis
MSKRSGNPAKRAAANKPKPRKAILWASNSPWATTGYGQQTAQVTKRLQADDHQVALASNYGLEATVQAWEGMKHFPRGYDLYSNDVVPAHMAAWHHEHKDLDPLLVTLFDTWVFKGAQWDMVNQIASWVPIDHQPCPPDVLAWCKRENVAPIAMSRFGEKMLHNDDVECAYAPHAIDTKLFKPTPEIRLLNGMASARQFMEVPVDAFVVGMNSANKGGQHGLNRKGFGEAFLAFGMWAQKRSDVVLYVHTEDKGAMGGIDLHYLAKACGIPDDRIKFVDQYAHRMGVPNEILAGVYTEMDVMLQPSLGEGFGIPAIEAQACGTPVIMTDATAQTELLGDGWLVPGQPVWDHSQKSWWTTPSIPAIIEALEAAYARGRERSETAIKFASQYDADYVYDRYWRPILDIL